MPDHVLQPREVCISSRRRTILPTDIINEFIRTPAGEIEGRIRHNEVCLELRVAIVKKRVRIKLAEVGFNTANGKIHLRHLPCGRVGVLTKNGNLVDVAAMIFDELCGLNEHTARAAARVINTPIKRLQHFNKGTHNARGSIELTSKFTFLLSKLGETVFVCTTENVLAVSMLDHLNVGEEINHLTKTPLVQLRTGEVLRQNIFEALVFFLNTAHCIINYRANFRRVSGSSNRAPSCILRDKEDVFGSVFVLVFFKSIAFFNQFLVLCLEAIRNVFQENQSENDGLVFGCVDVSAQDASRVPDLFFKADIACVILSHFSNLQSYSFTLTILQKELYEKPDSVLVRSHSLTYISDVTVQVITNAQQNREGHFFPLIQFCPCSGRQPYLMS